MIRLRLPIHVLAVIALAGFVVGLAAASSFVGQAEAADSHGTTGERPVAEAQNVGLSRMGSSLEVAGQVHVLLDRVRRGNPGVLDHAALQRAVDRWLFADPASCIAWLQGRNATGLVSRDLLPDVFASAMAGNLVTGIRVGGDILDPVLRAAWLHAIFDVASHSSPQRAMELLTYLPAKMQKEVGAAVISSWAASDGQAAWSAVVEGKQPHQSFFASEVIKSWARVDAAGMQVFLRSKLLHARNGREREILAAAFFLAQAPDTSLPILRTLVGVERGPVVQGSWWEFLRSVNRENADQALRVIEQEPQGAPRYAARAEIAAGLIDDDLERALSIVDSLPGFEVRWEILEALTAHLARDQSKEEEAAVLAQEQKEPLMRAKLMTFVTAAWVRKNTGAFVRYILAQPEDQAAAWFDRLAESKATDVGDGGELNESERTRLQVELSNRLPPEKVAEMLENLYLP